MQTPTEVRSITPQRLRQYANYLSEQEKAPATVEQYARALKALSAFLRGRPVSKAALIAWKQRLTTRYAATSVNALLAAVNSFLSFCDWRDCKLKPLPVQRQLFCREETELTRDEYVRLVRAAETDGNHRLSLVLQTICATGIRVSELRFITVEAARSGRSEVNNKGKRRTIFLSKHLRRALLKYAKRTKRAAGAVFVTRRGKPLDRSNIWRDMKALCRDAQVLPEKVFPHNLRHLFARTHYKLEKDLSRLADLLGHANVNTTRIYTAESGAVHAQQLERLGLMLAGT